MLEEGRDAFLQSQFHVAYNILRRYFDKLPFGIKPDHAEYLGTFAQTMIALGKARELSFYYDQFLAQKEKTPTPAALYGTAYLFFYTRSFTSGTVEKNWLDYFKAAPNDPLVERARLNLADFYSVNGKLGDSRVLIESIGRDKEVARVLPIWKMVLAAKLGQREEAIRELTEYAKAPQAGQDWYRFYSAHYYLAQTLIENGESNTSKLILKKAKEALEGRKFKPTRDRIETLERKLRGL